MDALGERRVLEEFTVTPFFKKHSGHMPASFSISAEIEETDDAVIFELKHPALAENDFQVDVDVNMIKVSFFFGEGEGNVFKNTYHTPAPIDLKRVKREDGEGFVRVIALKMRG